MPKTGSNIVLFALAAAFGACATPPPASPASELGCDLKIVGDEVSLAFTRDLNVPQFLQIAQQVTAERYVYQGEQVAAAGKLDLPERHSCSRSAFPAFVADVLRTRGFTITARGAGDLRFLEVERSARG